MGMNKIKKEWPPTALETLKVAFKAFGRSPVHGFTVREAMVLGLIQRDFTPRGEQRKRFGQVVLHLSRWLKRGSRSVTPAVPVAEMFCNNTRQILEIPSPVGRTDDEFKTALLAALLPTDLPPPCQAMDAYRRLVG